MLLQVNRFSYHRWIQQLNVLAIDFIIVYIVFVYVTFDDSVSVNSYEQNSTELIKDLSLRFIPPTKKNNSGLLRKLARSRMCFGPGRLVENLTAQKKGGFFVECGAGDGSVSDTLYLETHLGWTGLLVEPDPEHRRSLEVMNRNIWLAPLCMSPNTSAFDTAFKRRSPFPGGIPRKISYNSNYKVRCYPFLTFLLALNITTVDYFSLDVEGDEVDILKTVPFDTLNITVVSVQFSKAQGGLPAVRRVMNNNGYRVAKLVHPDYLFFVKKDYAIPQRKQAIKTSLLNLQDKVM